MHRLSFLIALLVAFCVGHVAHAEEPLVFGDLDEQIGQFGVTPGSVSLFAFAGLPIGDMKRGAV